MSLLVTGSIGIDDVTTPFGAVQGVYGGSAVYFSYAASLFTPVRFVGVVGEDFPAEFRVVLEKRDIDLSGLEVRSGSKTFRWAGSYEQVTSDARTTGIELNVLAEAGPRIPEAFKDSTHVFLAATHPDLQMDALKQLTSPKLVVADTRDLWITEFRDELLNTLSGIHGLVLNDVEARMLGGEHNLVLAGRRILSLGPQFVIIKKGENGVMLVSADGVAVLPAYPTTEVKDPTGAGDSFAGGMMGYLSTSPSFDVGTLKRALAYGTITASLTIEDFSLGRIATATLDEVEQRRAEYVAMLSLE